MFLIVAVTVLLPALIGLGGSFIIPAVGLYGIAGAVATVGVLILSSLVGGSSRGSGAIGVLVFGLMLITFGAVLSLSTLAATLLLH